MRSISIAVFLTCVFAVGCGQLALREMSRDRAIALAAASEEIDIARFTVLAEREGDMWVVIFYGRTGHIGDEYAFFVSDDGAVRRAK